MTIEDAEPTADFTFAYPGLERTILGVELLLDASNSRAGANTDPIEAYIWDFGDGNEQPRCKPSRCDLQLGG